MTAKYATQQPPACGGVDREQLLAALNYHFSYGTFRPNQLEAIEATLEGKDSLLIMPTGGGKSMTFQLPALAKGNCFTIVIGPLLALMKDQVEHCLELGIDARVWNSDVSEEQRKQVLSELVSDEPEMRLLYTTPESLRNPALRSYLKEAYEAGTLLSFAIDEAHCASDWGHDFRPAYLELASLRDDFPKTPIAAMTASCTPVVETAIMRLLRMRNPVVIKGGFNRPNIAYKVVYKELIGEGKQDEAVEHLIQFIQQRQGQCGIIYARLRATCDWLCSALCSADMDVGCYHAGKDAQRRRKTQQDWCTGAIDIVVATVAFGMGIDRADVRWVVHWDVPASLEGFYQESGRAGRDGQPSESVMYVSADDLDTVTKLEKGNRTGSVAAVANFGCHPGCRRKKLIDYFGSKRSPCNAEQELLCDYCSQPKATNQLLQQWEQQVTRRSIQHQLREQRQQMQAEEGQQQQEDCEQKESLAAACDDKVCDKDQPLLVRPRAGVWGSARAQSLPAAPVGYQQRHQQPLTPNSSPAAALHPQDSNTHAGGIEGKPSAMSGAQDSATAGVSGVKPPAAGPVMKPQLARKRPGSNLGGAFGAFKAPRSAQLVSKGSGSGAHDSDRRLADVEQGANALEQQQQQQQHLQQPSAIDVTAQASPSRSTCSTTAAAAIVPAGTVTAPAAQQRRAGRGRHGFVPPLKRV